MIRLKKIQKKKLNQLNQEYHTNSRDSCQAVQADKIMRSKIFGSPKKTNTIQLLGQQIDGPSYYSNYSDTW
jgi:hypothetical protein